MDNQNKVDVMKEPGPDEAQHLRQKEGENMQGEDVTKGSVQEIVAPSRPVIDSDQDDT